ncbi:unnamed protein product [Adineta steineri]|uniref:Uncharacterized protein n=1 Tax=Adineta steineri TaxID=433720 RepID=A0A814YYE3_9BILA|nr:unnamed protein product [Adineta steineri]CAF1278023.1 unnamed protein product [Adineta steineri]CAF3555078.1 unnamed protein product [Adineta steineri]CAF3840265.1 unnamed protein product [Adineta steineri]
MTSNSAFHILWLDAHISLPTECRGLKTLYQSELALAAAEFPVRPDPIDVAICSNLHIFGAPFTFASAADVALKFIGDNSNQKKIILITSASLGKEIIPKILVENFSIHSYYIFCGYMQANVAWASDYLDSGMNIQMFDFEIDLLLRLSRDLSNEFIEQGKILLNSNAKAALNYFECARALAEKAVERDTPSDPNDPHRPSTAHRRILDGENGLIALARRACNNNTS